MLEMKKLNIYFKLLVEISWKSRTQETGEQGSTHGAFPLNSWHLPFLFELYFFNLNFNFNHKMAIIGKLETSLDVSN